MKFLLWLTLTALTVVIQGQPSTADFDDLVEIRKKCEKKYNITPDEFRGVNLMTMKDPKLGEMLLCISTELKLMDEDGKFHVEHLVADIAGPIGSMFKGPEMAFAQEMVNDCAVQKSTPEESAQAFFACTLRTIQRN